MAILSIKLEMNIMETMTKMKITKTQLKQIIKEEIEKALEEAADPQSFVGTFEPLGDAPMGGDVPGADEHKMDKCKEIREKVAKYREQGRDIINRDHTGGRDAFYGYMMIDDADKLQKKHSHCFSTNESLKKKESLEQLVREKIEKILNENAGGYYIKYKPYSQVSFHDPEGNEMPDLDGNVDEDYGGLSLKELVMATENLPEFAELVNKEALEGHKAREAEYGREGTGLYPDGDMMDRYLMRGSSIDKLFLLYLQKIVNIPNAQVVEEPEQEEEESYGGYYGY